ncbi:hypothetical protein BGZ68_006990 [Mortierella alpina]|nr:hypothetical protein BGZ68_006990 [Mortierella alpina]
MSDPSATSLFSSSVNALFSTWSNALSLTPPELRMILIACTVTAANCPKILVPLVQQTLAEIASGSLSVPGTDRSPSPTDTTESRFAEQVRFIRRLREGLLKASSLCGGPYGINALGAVNFALEPELSAAVNRFGPVRSSNNVLTPEEYQQRGRGLFETIYQHHSNSSQDLVLGILRDTYGKLLSDTSLISIPETELCLVATLVPLNVPPQLKSHVYGARNVGVPMEQVQQLIAVAESITRWVHSQANDKSSL